MNDDDILTALWDGVASAQNSHPDHAGTLRQSYEAAKRDDNGARRLFYALEMSKRGGSADDFVVYGIECGRNAMPERAEEAFQKALVLEPGNAAAVYGLAMCAFERVELDKAEELLSRAAKFGPTAYGDKLLAIIVALPKNRPLPKREEARRKFWKHWKDTELTILTDEQRQKRMGEVVARRR